MEFVKRPPANEQRPRTNGPRSNQSGTTRISGKRLPKLPRIPRTCRRIRRKRRTTTLSTPQPKSRTKRSMLRVWTNGTFHQELPKKKEEGKHQPHRLQ